MTCFRNLRAWALLGLGASVLLASESDTLNRIWNGVYTAAQAQRGKDRFEKSCSECHNADLGGGKAPALRGAAFLKDWESGSTQILFVKLRDSMPAADPGSVPDQDKVDILAYLLQVNGFPAGKTELDQKELDKIQIVPKDGPAAPPNFALVRVVGCLSRGARNDWTLTRSTEPALATADKPSAEALKEAGAKSLGAITFDLIGAVPFQPGSFTGQKMEARGLLYRDPARNLINLTSLKTTGESCGN